jgi:bifunctional DNA-binding transcriptional regulator/antitoxin component of YhaV-PrlF toxin-antitoxin module
MTEKHIIGVSSLHPGNKITLIKKVRAVLDMEVGDTLVFYSANGSIIIEKA